MTEKAETAKAIFMSAIEKYAADQWPAFLEGACGDNVELRGRVEDLLQAHVELGSIHASAASPTADQPLSERTGAQIGPYKLLQKLGEGGMGVVFMAEQSEPVQRRVALKIIKPGMDTRQVIARFEAERQALAMMDHPNIARVLDAGATESGLPFFAMELVKGIPITQYCDEHRLSLQQRLQLFVDVCHAVQHAHQKGIIHRDLKPSNVLIAEYDDQAVPKIIDFGVAKAVQQRLTEKTMFTQIGQVVGTPEYMSPEQAKLNQLDIDTRSDIYALGVLLYELLTGETPFDRQRLRSAAFDEMLRILRDEEPPRPSLRLSTSQSLPSIAANRHVEPKKLSTLIRGELDWIVMKALEKERTRRYETANGFAADVDHYLSDEPVQACPPSVAYRVRKLARRYKGPLTAATLLLLALVTVAVGAGIAAARFRKLANENATLAAKKVETLEAEAAAAKAARQAQLVAEAARSREQSLREEAERQKEQAAVHFASARSAVDEFFCRVSENQQLTVPGLRSLRSELISSALEFYDDFAQDKSSTVDMQLELARAFSRIARIRNELGESDEAEAANNRAIEIYEQLRAGDHDAEEMSLGLAEAYYQAGRHGDAEVLCKELLAVESPPVEARRLLADTYDALAMAARTKSDVATALRYHREAQAQREKLIQDFPDNPEYHAELGRTLHHVGVVLGQQGEDLQALTTLERSVDAFQKSPQRFSWGRWHGSALQNLAAKQSALGRLDEAVPSSDQATVLGRKLVFQHPAVPALKADLYRAWTQLSRYQQQLGKTTEARRSSRAARQLRENIPRTTPTEKFELALFYAELSQPLDGLVDGPWPPRANAPEYADLAVQTLQEAIEAGYRNRQTLQTDESLAALRGRDDFRQLLVQLERELRAEQRPSGNREMPERGRGGRLRTSDVLRELVGTDAADLRRRKTLAATLYAVGEIHAGLKQYVAAEQTLLESLRIRRALLEKQRGDPHASLEVLKVQTALGRLQWSQGEYAQAHQRWQQVMDQTETLSTMHQGDPELFTAVADIERQICDQYGRIGLWQLAAEYPQRSLRHERMIDLVWDSRFSPLILVEGSRKGYDDYCQLYDNYRRESIAGQEWQHGKLGHLVWSCALVKTRAVDPQELMELGRRALETSARGFAEMPFALLHYRGGNVPAAAETFTRDYRTDIHVTSQGLNKSYFDAMLEIGLGNREVAEAKLSDTESLRRDLLRRSLTTHPPSIVGRYGKYWWELVYADQLRIQAWSAIHGTPPPHVAWPHLLQARGYRLIGESEKADAALAASLAAAPDDPEIWMLSARLRSEAGEPQRLVKADWDGAVARAGYDPLPWILRGRWYAEQGEHEKADADFAQAAKLTSNELDRFLQAGWWVAGPLSSDWEPTSAPSLEPDPAQPLPPTGQEEVKNTLAWQSLQPDGMGRLQFPDQLDEQGTLSVLLMTYVYSTDQRVATLRSNNRADYQVWINGEPTPTVEPSISGGGLSRKFFFTPLSLHTGRNTILIRLTGVGRQSQLDLRLDDHPLERAFDLARYGLLDDAAEVIVDRYDISLREDWQWLMSKFPVVHRRHLDVATRIVRHGKWFDDLWQAFHDSLLAEGMLDAETRLRLADEANSPEKLRKATWTVPFLGVTYAINDRPEKALAVVIDQNGGQELVSATRTIAYHRLGETQRARESLNQCYGNLSRAITERRASEGSLYWRAGSAANLYAAVRDTCREIEGDTDKLDSLYDEYQSACRVFWDTRGPAVSALDDLLLIAPNSEQERQALDQYLAEVNARNQQESSPTAQ